MSMMKHVIMYQLWLYLCHQNHLNLQFMILMNLNLKDEEMAKKIAAICMFLLVSYFMMLIVVKDLKLVYYWIIKDQKANLINLQYYWIINLINVIQLLWMGFMHLLLMIPTINSGLWFILGIKKILMVTVKMKLLTIEEQFKE